MSLIIGYFLKVRRILTHPTLFFREMPLDSGVSGPLCFALTTHWLGSIAGYLWKIILGESLHPNFRNFFERMTGTPYSTIDRPGRAIPWDQIGDQISSWFFGVASVIVDPFLTLSSILFTSFLVFIGARILVSPGREGHPGEITFNSALQIISFGMTPTILSGIPFVGNILAWTLTWVVTVIAAREVYHISTGKAVVISLFPKLLFIGIIGTGLFLLILLVFQFLAAL